MVGRLTSLACAATVLVVTPLASAQLPRGCELRERLLAAAPSGFAEFRGQPVPGTDNVFVPTEAPAGQSCLIIKGLSPSFFCLSAPLPEGFARQAYEKEAERLRRCFEDWETMPMEDVEGSMTTVDSLRFIRRGQGGSYSVGAALGWTEENGQQRWRSGVGVVWMADPLGV